MSGRIRLAVSTVESLEIPIKTSSDPTGAVPQFAISLATSSTPGSFSAGSWVGSYDATTKLTTARTPTLGATATLVVAVNTLYKLWTKVTLGGEVAVWDVGHIEIY